MSKSPRVANDANLLFVQELASRVVAQSGRATDLYHLGKLILQSLKDAPDFIMQIDGATGESVTFQQGLERSVRCATALRALGIKRGDVIVFMSPNYSDVAMVFYAALYLGVAIAPVDMNMSVLELKGAFELNNPKIILTNNDKADDVSKALATSNKKAQIITFDQSEKYMNYQEFLKKYSDESPVENFKPEDFDPEDTIALLIPTSGTTGLPKAAACSHKNLVIGPTYVWSRFSNFPTPTKIGMVCTTLQWMTTVLNYVSSPIMRFTRLHSSKTLTVEHAYYLINTYKPTFVIISPTLLINLTNPATSDQCDFSSFEVIYYGGSAVNPELFDEAQKLMPNAEICNYFGMSELCTAVFHPRFPSRGTCGTQIGCFQYRIIDVETQEDIVEPNVNGELWVKGPSIIKGYHNNPEATRATITEDNWLKTGDLFYRDENWNYFFVDRLKLLLKYKNYQISPVELEGVIQQHCGVRDAVVVGVPEAGVGELPAAFVIRHAGSDVTAQDIKDHVKSLLSDTKQLRGGVIFVDTFPVTATSKVHRMKLKQMALTMDRE